MRLPAFIIRRLVDLTATVAERDADFIIGQPHDPYMLRWWLTPRKRCLPGVYLHAIMRSDDDRALHDHPWWNVSILLVGGYIEHTPNGPIKRRAGDVVFRRPAALHRLELNNGTAWSLFIRGPKVREWGFACPKGWVHWKTFCGVDGAEAKGDEVGPGCGE